jgi:hypothetical protein
MVNAMTTWDPDGPGPMTARLVIGGSFTVAGTAAANNVAMYDPATGEWSALGSGMNNVVWALAVLPNGDLVAGGDFSTTGGVPAPYIARWGCVCPGRGSGACSRADWDENGVIDFNDLLAFFNTFNAQGPCADLNGDGSVDFNDFLVFMNLYTAGC